MDGSACTTAPRKPKRSFAWRHPEWWSLAVSGGAWLALATADHLRAESAALSHTSHLHAENGSVDWVLMVLAMMVPLAVEPIRATASRSLWERRHRAIAGFLVGYLSPWLIFGAAISVVESAVPIQRGISPVTGAAIGFALAALWQLAPWKRWALRACHRTMPLAPRGWRADRDCLRYGWVMGRACLASCWALMLACVLADHSLPATVCASSVALGERYLAGPKRSTTTTFTLLYGLALVLVIFAISGF